MASTPLTIVITGANRGIGLELTHQLLEKGHRVIAGARRRNLSLELKDLAERFPKTLTIAELDVQSDASVSKFRDSVDLDHVDVLINNAGIYLQDDGEASRTAPAKVIETLDTNAVGPVRVTQALLPLLKAAKNPKVANITSQMGSIADNGSGSSLAYRMSKTALNMFTKTLALDEREIIVLSLHPGWVQTRMGGTQAPLEPKTSAAGLIKVIEGANRDQSGRFLNYSGRELPW